MSIQLVGFIASISKILRYKKQHESIVKTKSSEWLKVFLITIIYFIKNK